MRLWAVLDAPPQHAGWALAVHEAGDEFRSRLLCADRILRIPAAVRELDVWLPGLESYCTVTSGGSLHAGKGAAGAVALLAAQRRGEHRGVAEASAPGAGTAAFGAPG